MKMLAYPSAAANRATALRVPCTHFAGRVAEI